MLCELALNPTDPRLLVRLVAIRYLASAINQFEFRAPDDALLPAFDAGSHIELHLGNRLVRPYSLAGSTLDRSRYLIGVKRESSGRGGSAWMFDQLKVGDLIEISTPRNNFALHEGPASSLLIAGGIGVTPMVSMIDCLSRQHRDWQLRYAVRRHAEAAFLDTFAQYGGRVQLHVDEEHGGKPIDLQACIAAMPADAHLYCCGPAPMLDAFERLTADRPKSQLHVERFSAVLEPAHRGGFVVELAKSKRSINVNSGESIAQALIQAGVNVSISCEQGVCGTCETRVLRGTPDHRDSLLSAQEKAANNVMMICCSGSLSESLLLDL